MRKALDRYCTDDRCGNCGKAIDGARAILAEVISRLASGMRWPEWPLWTLVCKDCQPRHYELLSIMSGFERNPPHSTFVAVFADNTQVVVDVEPASYLVRGPNWAIRFAKEAVS